MPPGNEPSCRSSAEAQRQLHQPPCRPSRTRAEAESLRALIWKTRSQKQERNRNSINNHMQNEVKVTTFIFLPQIQCWP